MRKEANYQLTEDLIHSFLMAKGHTKCATCGDDLTEEADG